MVGEAFGPCRASVGGAGFKMLEPSPFSRKWLSHKLKGPGLRCEIGICIRSGDIAWANGPFPCGSFPDLKIFRLRMNGALKDGENVAGDHGCGDERRYAPASSEESNVTAKLLARHETVNRRLKQLFALGHRFRHSLSSHSFCFHAIINLTQLKIEMGELLLEIK